MLSTLSCRVVRYETKTSSAVPDGSVYGNNGYPIRSDPDRKAEPRDLGHKDIRASRARRLLETKEFTLHVIY